jgi:Protein of unknown function (DUF1524)
MRTRVTVGLVALACALVVVAGFLVGPAVNRLLHPTPTATPTSSQERDDAVQALSSLETVTVRARTKVAGYDRSCSPGHGCVFGPAWSDDTTAAGGHNGCDSRNDVLAGQLQDVDKGTSRCVVQAGTLDDPYSGARIEFRKAQADEVQIDHVVPLAYAWDMGAAAWTLDQRMAFANDEALNLLAVAKAANASKSDLGPATWTPSNVSYRCQYAIRWVRVVSSYGLAVTDGDRDALRATLEACAR